MYKKQISASSNEKNKGQDLCNTAEICYDDFSL